MNAVYSLIERILPEKSGSFELKIKESDVEYYEIDNDGEKILLTGANVNCLCMAFGYYIKHVLNLNFSWCGSSLEYDELILPSYYKRTVEQQYRTYMNYCTHSYSCAWWNWERWEREIDIMAMNGINMPLSITGTEGVWYQTLLDMGFSDIEARTFLVGPAFIAWQLMGNIEAFAGPMPKSWITKHVELGRKIIDREVSLGMHPIQQGFSGFVPTLMKEKYPNASILVKETWNNIGVTAELDPKDPLFVRMGTVFLENQKKLFGAYGLYAADPFHESKPPIDGEEYLNDVGRTISEMFEKFDPDYKWVMQAWSVRKGIVLAVPKDRLIILDLAGVGHLSHNGFWGYSFLTGTLHNFGARMTLKGDLQLLADNGFKKIQKDFPNICGSGVFMEGIGQNPMYYDLAFDMITSNETVDLDAWLEDYCKRRYKMDDAEVINALKSVAYAVYTEGTDDVLKSAEIICTRPCLDAVATGPMDYFNDEYYDNRVLADAVKVYESKSIKTEGFFFDKLDFARQMMANHAHKIYKKCMADFKNRKFDEFEKKSEQFMELLYDFDSLLDGVNQWRLQTWIDNACAFAENEEEHALYEYNARMQITIWGNEIDCWLFDYAWKEWSGLVLDYYAVRWQKYFDMLKENHDYNEDNCKIFQKRIDWSADEFRIELAKWEAKWQLKRGDIKHGVFDDALISKILEKYDI